MIVDNRYFFRSRCYLPISLDMTTISQLSSAGQLTIPAAIRKKLGIGAGDPLQISMVDGRMIIEPVIVTPKNPGEVREIVTKIKVERAGLLDRLADL